MAAQILSASEFSDFLYYLGRSRFFSRKQRIRTSHWNQIRKARRRPSIQPHGPRLFVSITPDIPCAFVFGETNNSDEGSKIWYYPIYLLPFLKKNDGLLREKSEHHFLGNSWFIRCSFIPVLKTSKRHIQSLLIRSISNRQCPPLRTRYEYLLIRLSMI